MRRLFLMSLFFLSFSQLCAMDVLNSQSDSEVDLNAIEDVLIDIEQKGATIKDVRNLLDEQREHRIPFCCCNDNDQAPPISCIWGITLGVTLGVAFIPVILMGILGCTVPMEPGVCYAAFGILGVPVMVLASFLILPCLHRGINAYVDYKYNSPIDEIYEQLSDRDDRELMSKEDISLIKDFAFNASPQFYRNLNQTQVIFWGTLDIVKFREFANKLAFSDEVNILANRYFHVIDKDIDELNTDLKKGYLHKLIEEHPDLKAVIESLLGQKMPSRISLEESINLNEIDSILIVNDMYQFSINKDALINISGLFRAMIVEDALINEQIVLQDPYKESPKILEQMAKNIMPKITDDNLLELLAIAAYYQLSLLTKYCDEHIGKQEGALEVLTNIWLAQKCRIANGTVNEQCAFCTEFGLEKSKRKLLNDIRVQIKSMNDNMLFKKIAELDPMYREDIIRRSTDSITNSLIYPAKLDLYARLAMKFNIISLKEMICDFCDKPENAVIVSKIWMRVPDELRS